MHVHLPPGPRFEQSRLGTCGPTTTAGKCTNLGCSLTTCTTLPQRFSGRLSAPRLWSSENLSDLRWQGYTSQLTLTASSAKGLQFTHHCGLSTGSMISPDLLCTKRVSLASPNHIRLPADGNLHRVVLGVNKEISFLESLHYSHPGVEPFHTLQWRQSRSVE